MTLFPGHHPFALNELKRINSIQIHLIWISWITLIIVLFAELWWGNILPAILITGTIFSLLIPYWLTRRGYITASGILLITIILSALTALAWNGRGIHDIAAITYPLVIIFASLTLNRNGFITGVGLTVICIAILVFGEAYGLLNPILPDKSDAFDFLIVTSILIATSLIINVLVKDIQNNLALAKSEIEQRKKIEEDLRAKTEEVDRYFSVSLDLFCIADTNGMFRRLNPQWTETLGYELSETEGKSFLDLVHPEDLEPTLAAVSRLKSQEIILNFENRYRCKDGTYRWIDWRSYPSGDLIYAAARDITERRQMEEQLRFQGTHDNLTGLFNRSFFEEEMSRLEGGRKYPISIVMADVDGLKIVNDTQGHAAGDRLLQNAARMLKSTFRTEDVVARIGGDEFAVLMPNTDSESVKVKLDAIKKKMVENNENPANEKVSISLGGATAEKGDLIGIFTLADQRMYQDKATHAQKKLNHSKVI